MFRLGVVRVECFLADRQRALVNRLSLCVLALVGIKRPKIIEAGRDLRVVKPGSLLANFERPLVKRPRQDWSINRPDTLCESDIGDKEGRGNSRNLSFYRQVLTIILGLPCGRTISPGEFTAKATVVIPRPLPGSRGTPLKREQARGKKVAHAGAPARGHAALDLAFPPS